MGGKVSISRGNELPVCQVPVSLGSLSTKVGQVASEKEVVLGRDGKGVAHEGGSVDNQGAGHRAGDTVERKSVSTSSLEIESHNWDSLCEIEVMSLRRWNVHLRVLLGVHHSRNGNTEVGDWAPEVYNTAISAVRPTQYDPVSNIPSNALCQQLQHLISTFSIVDCKVAAVAGRSRCPGSATGNSGLVQYVRVEQT